ncbi:viperin family antiviral radical SAM protein [Shimia biformata]|uniref:viperin family antiviral radical SAM protein n=1 Tax=Shimia biformata TaxID=1294299 RepID=UPI001950E6C1|nr:viperin family antiviral radical SAM protein [Shimia biformata]
MLSEQSTILDQLETTSVHTPVDIDQLVINWHVNEACNYRCAYCYAKWSNQKATRDLIRNDKATEALLKELRAFFSPSNHSNPLRSVLSWKRVRMNFAGGEPLLDIPSLLHAIRTAKKLDFDVSIITNGSRLDQKTLYALAPHLEWLGLSIDAVDASTNHAIGRVDRRGRLLDLRTLSDAIDRTRALYPSMKFKINTVVSDANYAADLSPMLDSLNPEKWKVLRVLPMVTDAGVVSDEEFARFVDFHSPYRSIMRVEDNFDMLKTYLMIDPKGRFFQNRPDAKHSGYLYSSAILDSGAAAAFSDIELSACGFASRYK